MDFGREREEARGIVSELLLFSGGSSEQVDHFGHPHCSSNLLYERGGPYRRLRAPWMAGRTGDMARTASPGTCRLAGHPPGLDSRLPPGWFHPEPSTRRPWLQGWPRARRSCRGRENRPGLSTARSAIKCLWIILLPRRRGATISAGITVQNRLICLFMLSSR